MNIRGRLFLQGALLPSVALGALVVGGGFLLDRALLRSVDESLTSQAAVEAISLFDKKEYPHLHLEHSPLRPQVETYFASRAVYGPGGARLVEEIGSAPLPEEWPAPTGALGQPILRTLSIEGEDIRELSVVVESPEGKPHTLLLRSGLGRVDHVVGTYFRLLGFGALLVTILFVIVQAKLSSWWACRIHNMIQHTRRLEAGDLASRPAPDLYDDEIGELTTAIARASERLEEARRAQDRLVADAAHELRTPLAAMRAEIDVTLRRPREAEALRQTLSEVREEVDRLDALSTHLLDLARWASGAWRMEEVEVRALVDEVVDAQTSVAAQRGVRVTVDGAPLRARLDPTAMRQAVQNLVSNAVKFSPEGGEVRVALSAAEDRWRLCVSDEGPGVPEAERTAVFEPFHRLDARVPGTGLGLAIVRDVAAGHRGAAWVEPTGPGATFVLEAARS